MRFVETFLDVIMRNYIDITFRVLLFLLFVGVSNCELISNEVQCDFEAPDWFVIDESHIICYIRNQTIDNNGFILASSANESVKGLKISDEADIKFIPENIAETFPLLTVIEVHDCAVEIVGDKSFRNLRELLSLNLNSNEIETVESGAFSDLLKLEHLSIGDNKIEFLTSTVFKSLENLKLLYLGDNKIQFISENILDGLLSLTVVSFEKNELQSIGEAFFKNNRKLERIGLHENIIKHISSRTFNDLNSLQEVDLEDNDCISTSYEVNSFDVMRKDLKLKCMPLQEAIFENLEEIHRLESEVVQCKANITQLMEKFDELAMQLNAGVVSQQWHDEKNANKMIANQTTNPGNESEIMKTRTSVDSDIEIVTTMEPIEEFTSTEAALKQNQGDDDGITQKSFQIISEMDEEDLPDKHIDERSIVLGSS